MRSNCSLNWSLSTFSSQNCSKSWPYSVTTLADGHWKDFWGDAVYNRIPELKSVRRKLWIGWCRRTHNVALSCTVLFPLHRQTWCFITNPQEIKTRSSQPPRITYSRSVQFNTFAYILCIVYGTLHNYDVVLVIPMYNYEQWRLINQGFSNWT